MKRKYIYGLLLSFLLSSSLSAQRTEYWVDVDPGRGKATALSLVGDVGTVQLNTSSLSKGIHVVGIRTAQGRKWGQTYTHTFLVTAQGSSVLTAAEYWVDVDPGRGKATPIETSGSEAQLSIPLATDALAAGIHTLGVRVRQGDIWGQTYTHTFLVTAQGSSVLTGAEYWVDVDPGRGKATPIETSGSEAQLSIPLATDALAAGIHTIGVRVRQGDIWGQTYTHTFLVTAQGSNVLTGAEYWVDADPGRGKATALETSGSEAQLSIPLDVDALAAGIHTIGVRVRQGEIWGQTYTHTFLVTAQGSSVLTAAEYWVDVDPGRGKATPIETSGSETQLSIPLATDALAAGIHTIGVRVRQGDIWGQTYTHTFLVTAQGSSVLTGAEYWVDADPGRGKATALETSGSEAQLSIPLATDALAAGIHTIGVRVRQGDIWGQTYTHSFFITPSRGEAMTIEALEAYWDYDWEHAISIPFTQDGDSAVIAPYSLPTDALSYGVHQLSIRAKADGKWGILDTYEVCKNATPLFSVANAAQLCEGEEVTIQDETLNKQPFTTYRWDVNGDEQTDYTDNSDIHHTFATAGVYTVSLTVQTGEGCEDTYSQEVVIHSKAAPSVGLARSASAVCAGEEVLFVASPTHGGEQPTFRWLRNGVEISGGDGDSLILSDLVDGETIQVKLTTSNPCAEEQDALSPVLTQTVYDLPQIEFNLAEVYYTDEIAFSLSNMATPAGGTFYINDEETQVFNPEANTPGTYTVRYEVSNGYGCGAEAETTFELKERGEGTDIENVSRQEVPRKLLHEDHIYILRGNKIYTITGQIAN